MKKQRFVRIHSAEIAPRTGKPYGLFVAIWKLVDGNLLTEGEVKEYWENRKRFEAAFPVPPFYDDQNTIKAITYFKDNEFGLSILSSMDFYFEIALRYSVPLYKTVSEGIPGRLVYEDNFQIGVVPFQEPAAVESTEKLTEEAIYELLRGNHSRNNFIR